ncbi:MFS transporter [Roseiflexus castenholzii]|uniref:MFS transporter n=1 Tax=Roseiflexus castenholzii TaxID=120962 RepID=UPI003C799118
MPDETPCSIASSAAPTPIADLTMAHLAIVTGGRLALVAAFRIIYPLQPFLTGELNVDLRAVSALITVQLAASMLSPIGGALADTRGERATMSGGLAIFALGTALCALSPSFTTFLIGYTLVGLAIALYQPAAQAYLSARTPYARRGWALGVFETSWALGALLGVAPLMQIVQTTQQSMPAFWVLSAAGLASLALVWTLLPDGSRNLRAAARRIDWRALRAPGPLLALLFVASTLCAYDLIQIVQAPWLRETLAVNEAQLGQLVALAGIGELIGAMGVALLGDRLGIRRTTAAGFLLAAMCVAALPFVGREWTWLLPVYLLLYLSFEYAIVAAFPLISAVAPTARGTMLALSAAAIGAGRVAASLVATSLWLTLGIGWTATITATILCGSLLCLLVVKPRE